MRYFDAWRQSRGLTLEHADAGDFREYLEGKGWANATQRDSYTAARGYLTWAGLTEHSIFSVKITKQRARKLPYVKPQYFTQLLVAQDTIRSVRVGDYSPPARWASSTAASSSTDSALRNCSRSPPRSKVTGGRTDV